MDSAPYEEYVKYFRSKNRVGVVRLDEDNALFIVPPCEEAGTLITNLQAAGAPQLPRNALLGVIAPSPGP